MPRRIQTNSFEKGMDKSLSKDRVPTTKYRDAQNFRLSDDEEKSGGALVNVLGNSLNFTIPSSPSCWVVKPKPNIGEPGAGITDDLTINTNIGSYNIPVTLTSGGFVELFNRFIDATGPGTTTYNAGIRVVRTSPKSIAVYSLTVEIINVNVGTAIWTEGTKLASLQSDLEIIGWTELRDSFVLFTTNNDTQAGGSGQIWFVTYDKALDTYTPEIRYTCDTLNFSKWHPIEAVARYENSQVQRVYWTDNFNRVRSLNIATIESSMGVDPNFLDLEPGADFAKPVLELISTGGTLKAGIYQYAYRMKSSAGSLSKFSPASNLTNVMIFSESGLEWNMNGEYIGSNPGDATTKSVKCSIKNLDASYDIIEIVYLYYGALNATPEIFKFEEISIPASGELTFTHTGSESTSIISETEYKSFGIPFERAKTISYQDNRLLVGNVSSSDDDKLQFHARAYRFGNDNVAVNTKGSSGVNDPFNSGNSYDVLNWATLGHSTGAAPLPSAATDIRSYVPGLDVNQADWGYADPEDPSVGAEVRDAINPYNYSDWLAAKHLPFKFQTDGKTLGGEGPYVKYDFCFTDQDNANVAWGPSTGPNYNPHLESYVANNYQTTAPLLSSNKPNVSYDFNTNGEQYNSTNTPRSSKSPYLNNTIRGYMTGEVYRFGIVLYDKAGNPGFVNWVGDIKFPELWEIRANCPNLSPLGTPPGETKAAIADPGYSNDNDILTDRRNNGTRDWDFYDSTYGMRSMGVRFEVTIPDNIIEGISGYEIVRVKRTQADKTKLTQGYVQNLANPVAPNDKSLYLLPGKGGPTSIPAAGLYGNIWKWDPNGGIPGSAFGLGYTANPIAPDNIPRRSLVMYSPELQFNNDVSWSSEDRLRLERFVKFERPRRYSPTPQTSLPIGYPLGAFPAGPANLRILAYQNRDNSRRFLTNPDLNYGDLQNTVSGRFLVNSRGTIPITFARDVDKGETISTIPTIGSGVNFKNATIPTASYNTGNEPQVDGCDTTFMTVDTQNMHLQWGGALPYGLSQGMSLATWERAVPEQYGGATQANRANNYYIKTGGYIAISDPTQPTTKFMVFGGDTYHLEYDWTRVDGGTPVDANADATRDGMVFPLLTSINVGLRKGRHLLNKAKPDNSYPPATDTTYQYDTYELEDLYDREQDYVFFIGRPEGTPLVEEFDNRIYASNAKINGEVVDQWRQWDIGTYIDVEGSLGPINKLIINSGQNFFFQNHGCGFLLINPSAAVTTVGAGQLTMGYGNVLHDFTYVSTEIGCFHQWAPVTTNDNLFFIDIYSKQMYSIKGQSLLPISLAGGMSPWFDDALVGLLLERDNPIMNEGITTTWDRRFNEVWVTLNNLLLNATCTNSFFDIYEFSPGYKWFALKVSDTCLTEATATVGSIVEITIDGNLLQYEVLAVGASGSSTYLKISSLPSPYTAYPGLGGLNLNDALLSDGTQNMTPDGITAYNFIVNQLSQPPAAPGQPDFSFTVKHYTKKQQTVVYNEAYDIYTGFYSHTPPIYINDGLHVLSPKPSDRDTIYKHNSGEYGKFYDTIHKSSLELTINDSKGVTKVFDNIGYHSEVWTNAATPINITLETFDKVRFYTDFQNSDWVSLVVASGDIKRIEREWQLDVARNAVSQLVGPDVDIFDPANLNQAAKFKNRLRDKCMTINLELNNSNNRRFLLHYLKTFYRFSIR